MGRRWLTGDGVNMPQWLVTLIVAGIVGLAGLTYWDGRAVVVFGQQIKGLTEIVMRMAEADKEAHGQMQRNSRDIAEIRGRLAMTPAGRPGRAGGPRR